MMTSGPKTRGQHKQANEDKKASHLQDDERSYLKLFEQFVNSNECMRKDSFHGLRSIIKSKDPELQQPVIIIIKNIKTFPSAILNDLIHLMHKFRGTPYYMRFNLMLGIQNNNQNELHLRVKVQNCIKLVVRTCHFPCMKHVILEGIYQLILSKANPFVFQPEVIQNLVEIINLYGMSILKFKRILKYLISTFFFNQEFYYIYDNKIDLKAATKLPLVSQNLYPILRDGFKSSFKSPESIIFAFEGFKIRLNPQSNLEDLKVEASNHLL